MKRAAPIDELAFALRHNGIPLKAINLDYFSDRETTVIKAAYAMDYSTVMTFKELGMPIIERPDAGGRAA